MDETDWDAYGTGNYEKCADCMVHSGFEATAVQDAVRHPLKAFGSAGAASRPTARWRPRSRSRKQRPAQYVFSRHVEQKLSEIRVTQARAKESTAA